MHFQHTTAVFILYEYTEGKLKGARAFTATPKETVLL